MVKSFMAEVAVGQTIITSPIMLIVAERVRFTLSIDK